MLDDKARSVSGMSPVKANRWGDEGEYEPFEWRKREDTHSAAKEKNNAYGNGYRAPYEDVWTLIVIIKGMCRAASDDGRKR